MRWIIAFLFVTYLMTVHSQTWVGTFTADSGCDTNQCCCLSNKIVIGRPTSDTISFNTSLTGICLGQTSYSGITDYPDDYVISVSVSIITLTITLSSDSNSIDIINSLGPSCGVTATRDIIDTTQITGTIPGNDAVRKYINTFTFFSLAFLLCVVINIQIL
ncbi:unnamed protein product [Rotaria sp. Silwood2]|nr:unnamed protein product [Rotaria sp. Silwood2]CAF3178272.1 unnamed protein product [Rotaria sp. Silwood2]CAF4416268.1 unnamed protein product [Rotaria sp. Silwood2]CAF4476698.1 unnamed protein product [Rotaria sp. Silwood2]